MNNTFKLWFLLNKPSQERLRKLMPKGWKPPRRGNQKVRVEGKIEDIEELEKIMSQKQEMIGSG